MTARIVIDPVQARAEQRVRMGLPLVSHEMTARGGVYVCEACEFRTINLTRVAAHTVSTQFRVR